jgi:glutathionylspermidine synthase
VSASAAVNAYHELLADDALAQESSAVLTSQLSGRGLVFGGRPLATVLRPRLVTRAQFDRVVDLTKRLMPAFDRILEAALTDSEVRAQFRLAAWEESLVGVNPGFRHASPTSRLDYFVDDASGEISLTEFNAETPAGAAYNDALSDTFADLPVMRKFTRDWEAMPIPTRHGVIRSLLDAWSEWRGVREVPHIGIIDWKEVPTASEFALFQEHFRALGIPCSIVDPRDAEYDGETLSFAGTPITLLYKRVLLHELVERGGADHLVFRAVRDGKVCMVNPPRCKILHKKASLAALTDERNAHLLSAEQHAAVASCIPWTRVVEERATMFHGERIDLLSFAAAHRERLVLKPNDDYGGAGIVLGWTVGSDEWNVELRNAVINPYVVQERVSIPSEGYPSLVDGKVQIVDRMYDTAPFLCDGAYMDGWMSRLSTAALLNVTAGGGSTVPTFLVQPR